MKAPTAALLLIGFQNDYFAPTGSLTAALEDSQGRARALRNSLDLMHKLSPTKASIINTPIIFTKDYRELNDPIGILKVIRDVGAFREGTPGAATIPEFAEFGARVDVVPGKRGLNAFSNTELETLLRKRGVTDVIVAGVVTSLCIDSTARQAMELGFRVTVLSDCTSGRTQFEQEFYCEKIFPLYATVKTKSECLEDLNI